MTMIVFNARNVNEAYDNALMRVRMVGGRASSRNGDVIKFPGPVATVYARPRERILWDSVRDVNSVFHLVESIWMFAGHSEAAFLLPFNARMAEFAEDDGKIHGAYGRRWRFWFGQDQILHAVHRLRANPSDRRVVIGMWDPLEDNTPGLRDVPCNTHIYFNCRTEGTLDMTVCCRSNDMIWGAYGANAVHMSMLHELVAAGAGLSVGEYTQFSNDFHIYTDMPNFDAIWATMPNEFRDEYRNGVYIVPLLREGEGVDDFMEDCEDLLAGESSFRTHFISKVADPLISVYVARKNGDDDWPRMLANIPDCDWKLSFEQWTNRRSK